MTDFESFRENCLKLRERVAAAESAAARKPGEVKILPVTKNHPIDAVAYAAKLGFKGVGENRVQEAVEKIKSSSLEIEWELIGHLQTNKAKIAAKYFSRIQSLDSARLAQKLDAAAKSEGRMLPVLLEINAGADPAKFGASMDGAAALLESVLALPNLEVQGLMTVAPLDSDLDTASRCFANLYTLRDKLRDSFRIPLPELSMGMSHDLERAIAEGSTMIRVGTFLYGERI